MSEFPNFIKFGFMILCPSDVSSISLNGTEVHIGMKLGPHILKKFDCPKDAQDAVYEIWELIKKSHKANSGVW